MNRTPRQSLKGFVGIVLITAGILAITNGLLDCVDEALKRPAK